MNTEPDSSEPTAATADPAGAIGDARSARLRAAVAGAAALALAAFAYRALLTFRPTGSITVEVEGWFFEPSDTSPTLVIGLALWLLYRRAGRLARLGWQAGSHALTAALYAGAVAIDGWALATEASDLQALSLMLVCLGSANLLGGRAALRVVWLPVLFLLFAVPIPSPLRHAIVWKFQIWTADATGWLLYLLGIPAVVSGDRILLADTTFAVIETCSGLRSVITLSMLAVLMVDLFRRTGTHAALVLAVAPLLAFGANALRSLGLVLNPASNIAEVHSLQGIAMLLVSVFVLYGFDGLLERLRVPGGRGRPRGPAQPRTDPLGRRLAWVYGVLGLLALLSVVIVPWRVASPSAALPADAIPRRLGAWRSADLQTDRLFLGMAALTGAVDRRYVLAGESVDVFAAAGSPRQRFRSFYSPKTALPGSGWIVEETGERELAGHDVDVLVVRREAERRLVYHWYQGTRGFWQELVREALALDSTPFARDRRGAVVRISTPLGASGSMESAEARLEQVAGLLDDVLN